MSAKDIDSVVKTAVAVKSVSQAAEEVAKKAIALSQKANVDIGIRADRLKGTRVFLVQVLIDDSGSMEGFEAAVIEAFQKLLKELREAAAEATGTDILISVTLLNRGQIQAYVPVDECVGLSFENYTCHGNTPLYGQTNRMLGTLMAKVSEVALSARNAQTFTCIISDGKPTDGINGESAGPRFGEESALFDPAEIATLIRGLTSTKQHICCGVSIGGLAHSTFVGMGINERWILDPTRDQYAFDRAIQQISRASRSASKGAGQFQSIATSDGFR